MSWQDVVLALGNLIFTIALFPSLRSSHKPALATAIPTALVLFVFSGTMVSLSLWYASITTFAEAVCWGVLAFQKWRLNG